MLREKTKISSPDLIVPCEIRHNENLNLSQKMFISEIDSQTQNDAVPFSSRTFGLAYGLSHQTVINYVNRLEKMGYLEIFIDENNNQFIKSKLKKTA